MNNPVFEYDRVLSAIDEYMSKLRDLGVEGWECFHLDFNREQQAVAIFVKRKVDPIHVHTYLENLKLSKADSSAQMSALRSKAFMSKVGKNEKTN